MGKNVIFIDYVSYKLKFQRKGEVCLLWHTFSRHSIVWQIFWNDKNINTECTLNLMVVYKDMCSKNTYCMIV